MEPLEWQYWKEGKLVAGLDEAGRGPLAGPVVVACVVFPPFTQPFLDRDSKKLSPAKREYLFEKIVRRAMSVTVAFAGPREIEAYNIYKATRKAYYKALKLLPIKPDLVITDYMPLKSWNGTVLSPPKADEKFFSVAAASIVAKVIRDKLMELYGKRYPDYGFEKHKGYPTGEHIEAINTLGVLPIHRRNYKPVKEKLKKKGLF
jgi:ribonuclease HII